MDEVDVEVFLEGTLWPAVLDRLDVAFPEFGWERKGGGWVATSRDFTKAQFGARPERVVCNKPGGFLVHGDEPLLWTAHANGGTKPTGKDFFRVIRDLADRVGVDASVLDRDLSPEERIRLGQRKKRDSLLETFMELSRSALLGDPGQAAARDYLITSRGFAPDALGGLPLGVYTKASEVEAGLREDYSSEEIEASGLLADGRWEGRLIIPWRDASGSIATLAARSLDGAEPKYLYLKGGSKPVAFGLDVAKDMGAGEPLVLVEGLMDVVLLHSLGLKGVAATGATLGHLTSGRWATLVGQGFKGFILAPDGDPAGREGALKALANVRKVENVDLLGDVYVVDPSLYGDAKDPDEMVRAQGLDAFETLLERPLLAIQYEGAALFEGISPDSPEKDKRQAVDAYLELHAKLRGSRAALNQEDLTLLVQERTGYTAEALSEVADSFGESRRKEQARLELGRIAASAEKYRDSSDPVEAAKAISEKIQAVLSLSQEKPPAFSVDRLLAEIEDEPGGRSSGWSALDSIGVKLSPGFLVLAAARTGHGKTSFLVSMVSKWLAEDSDEMLLVYSHEESEVRIFQRLLSVLSANAGDGWTVDEIGDRIGDRGERETYPDPASLETAKDLLAKAEKRLQIVHRPAWTSQDITTHAQEIGSRRRVGGVFVDYLQRIPVEEGRKFDRRDQEVSAINRTLKSLAESLSCPVIVGAQVNREAIPPSYRDKVQGANDYQAAIPEIRKSRPDLNHLREGGSEQEADVILGLLNYAADYRTEEGERLPESTRLDVGVIKNRYGAAGGWTSLAFEGRFGRARDLEPAEDLE